MSIGAIHTTVRRRSLLRLFMTHTINSSMVAGDSELTALDAATGVLRWSRAISPPVATQPVLAAGLLTVLDIYDLQRIRRIGPTDCH